MTYRLAGSLRRVLLFAMAVMLSVVAVAQDDISGKLSISTQIFLNNLHGRRIVASDQQPQRNAKTVASDTLSISLADYKTTGVALPVVINDTSYIEAFVRTTPSASEQALQSKGVRLRSRFKNGLSTALIPVDSIGAVASLADVSHISVAEVMSTETDEARRTTNVDDVLTLSNAALQAGLDTKYDGKGVLIGVIDVGIDFQHIAFRDKDGNSRIKRAYVFTDNSSSSVGTEYTSIDDLTTDNDSQDHGTHTSSIAGGSNVVIDGDEVKVTDDASEATYGGMAPACDLYLAGLNTLLNTRIAEAFQKICNYADTQGEPVVVSNSWSNDTGSRSGQGEIAEIVNQYFGDDHPNHICLFAASNYAGNARSSSSGGGRYISGTSSASSPLGAVICTHGSSGHDDGYSYSGYIAEAWTRSTASGMSARVIVINATTGAHVATYDFTSIPSGGTSRSISSRYYTSSSGGSGRIYAYLNYTSETGKTNVRLYTPGLTCASTSSDGATSNYRLAIQIYPTGGIQTIDIWGGSSNYFTDHPTTSGYTWTQGDDKSSINNEASIKNVISIGAYVTKNSITDHNGTVHSLASYPTIGDIAYFSSYQEEGVGPGGNMVPWITAPGAGVVSAVNHYHTSGGYIDESGTHWRVNGSTTYPYGHKNGTSMATPAAAGIVALWLQAAKDVGRKLTTSVVKQIMKTTAIHDEWTDGDNKAHFGNGKIDALAGINYILQNAPVRYKSSKDDIWHPIRPDAEGAYNITDNAYYAFDVTEDVSDATVNYTRQFTQGRWAAWLFPADVTIGALTQDFCQFGSLASPSGEDGRTSDNMAGASIGVEMLSAGQTASANTPYMVYPTATGSKTFALQGVTLYKTEPQTTTVSGNAFTYTSTGVYERKAYDNDVWYALAAGKFQRAGTTAWLNPFRFYLSVTDKTSQGAKPSAISLSVNGTPTGIDIVPAAANSPASVYDLQGRRVEKPVAKGVYIVNGRKIIISK